MSHSSTPLSSPSSVSASQRLACGSALECAPGISTTEQCHFTLHSIPFSPCHAPQRHFVYRATSAFWTDGKMSWNANGLLMLLWQGPHVSLKQYLFSHASFVKVVQADMRRPRVRRRHVINKETLLIQSTPTCVERKLIWAKLRWLKLTAFKNKTPPI